MAKVFPDGWEQLTDVPYSVQRELETLRVLADELPGAYTIYHGVHWTTMNQRHAIYGEIDFIVVSPGGHLLLIEQKLGMLTETPEGDLVKQYESGSKSVQFQMARSRDAILTKLRQKDATRHIRVQGLLYCPNHAVRSPHAVGLVAERIVDARERHDLAKAIVAVLPMEEPADCAAVHRFLRDTIRLEADVSAMVGSARSLVTRISGGLAYWARQVDVQPWRLRVTGTAGSGKTQLALAEFKAALDAGRRPLYVCFNRPLADHMAAIVPSGGMACTFHALCEALLRAHGRTQDFFRPGAFADLERSAGELPVPEGLRFDSLILDEGQDWSESWRDMALRHARDGARLLWLEDPMQNLYGRAPVALPGWVGLRAMANYRSPRKVVNFLQRVLGDAVAIEAMSPIEGDEIEVLTYATQDELLSQVKIGIKNCHAAGFRTHDVAVISYHGRESSFLQRFTQLSDFTFRSFTGNYDLLQQPIYSEGDILMESVMRFKGQSTAAVVFAEVDFDQLNDKAMRRLFVGMTRASMKLVLVLSETAAAKLLERVA